MLPHGLVVVGRIGSPHGVAGAVRVASSTQPPENIEQYRPWMLISGAAADEDPRPVEVLALTPHPQGYVARLAGVADRDAAAGLSGLLVAVPRAALPEPESDREYYWQDLIGMSVTDTADEALGTVRRLLATGANDVLVIGDGRRETLVPFLNEFVVDVDLARRHIRVDWQDPA